MLPPLHVVSLLTLMVPLYYNSTPTQLLPIVATLFLTLFASAKTCVETEDNVFFCTDDSKKAKEKARKTWQHYIQYHSVPQTIEGSDEERKKSSDLITRMEKYLKVWVMYADREEDVKERW